MKVLSLFDGISCARVALEKLGIDVECYFASEVDEMAIQTAQKNWSDQIQLGSVKGVTKELIESYSVFCDIDLLIGGSPCQDLSVAKAKRQGLKGERSGLFYEYVRILQEIKPKWFILENVASMPNDAKEEISKALGVEPIMINAALVSAQNRKRLFWTNIPGITQPKDRGIMLEDIIHETKKEKFDPRYILSSETAKKIRTIKNTKMLSDKANSMTATMWKGPQANGCTCIRIGQIGNGGQGERIYSVKGKAISLPASPGYSGTKTGIYLIHKKARGKNTGGLQGGKTPTLTSSSWEDNNHLITEDYVRKLTPVECERLQSLPDGYTEGISSTQRYKALGNAFNVEVVRHIISHIPKQ